MEHSATRRTFSSSATANVLLAEVHELFRSRACNPEPDSLSHFRVRPTCVEIPANENMSAPQPSEHSPRSQNGSEETDLISCRVWRHLVNAISASSMRLRIRLDDHDYPVHDEGSW